MNGPQVVPVTVGPYLLNVKYSILQEVHTGVAAITLHVVSGHVLSGPTKGRIIGQDELAELEDEYAAAIEGALWEWYAEQSGTSEEGSPCATD